MNQLTFFCITGIFPDSFPSTQFQGGSFFEEEKTAVYPLPKKLSFGSCSIARQAESGDTPLTGWSLSIDDTDALLLVYSACTVALASPVLRVPLCFPVVDIFFEEDFEVEIYPEKDSTALRNPNG